MLIFWKFVNILGKSDFPLGLVFSKYCDMINFGLKILHHSFIQFLINFESETFSDFLFSF